MTTVMSGSALDQRIASLESEAKSLEESFRKTIGEKFAEIGEAYAQKAAELSGGSVASVPVAVPRSNGRAAVAVRKKPGRKSGSASGKVSPKERNYDNKVSLRQSIWDILARGKALKVSEIKEIIEKEKQWVSNSDDINPQIQQHLYGLKKHKKIERDAKEHTYSIRKGATL